MSRIRARTRSRAIKRSLARKGQMRKMRTQYKHTTDKKKHHDLIEKFRKLAPYLHAEKYLSA